MKPMKDLSDLVGSRICHDLISPLGAIGNGLELLTLTGGAHAPEIALITDSVANANARIRFFRVAFGSASGEAMLGAVEVASILEGVYGKARTKVRWKIERDLRRTEVKLAFLLIQCLETALPWGGRITVSRVDDRLLIAAEGDRLKVDAVLWECLGDPKRTADIAASDVQFALAPLAALRIDRKIYTKVGTGGISVTV